jgi:hypothetical protein
MSRRASSSMPTLMKRSSSRRSGSRTPSGVAGAGQLAGRIDHRAQHRLQVELGEQGAADVDQAAETLFVDLAGGQFGALQPIAR